MLRRIVVGLVGFVMLALPAGASAEGGCANEAVRQQQGYASRLADCRAYELVTPVVKGDGSLPPVLPAVNEFFSSPSLYLPRFSFQSSVDGGGFAFSAMTPFPGAVTGDVTNYLAARGGGGWSSRSITPPQVSHTGQAYTAPFVEGYSEDLSSAAFVDGGTLDQDSPPLVAGEPEGNLNLFLRDNVANSYRLMDSTPVGVTPAPTGFEGASADFSHVVFVARAQLTPDAANGVDNLFEYRGGVVSLVGQVPVSPATRCGGGGPACVAPVEGAVLGGGLESDSGGFLDGVSPDGSKVYFRGAQSADFGGQLYVRENGTTTVEISASQKTNGSGPGGRDPLGPRFPEYWPASRDGSKAFFTSCEQLTDDSTANASESNAVCGGSANRLEGSDLYEYDTASESLSDLTVDRSGDPFGADVQAVFGSSADGSYVYYVANGVLASGATPGNCHGVEEAGQCNLYVTHNGVTTFIARIDGVEGFVHYVKTARVSVDGTRLAFVTPRSLTGYDNRDGRTGEPDSEVYLYDATSGQLVCVSCNPSGARPMGPSSLMGIEGATESGAGQAAEAKDFEYLPRDLSDDGGRLFFDSGDALVPGDVNGREDVYEWEGGVLHLVSSGTGSEASLFLDASPSGNDAFFATHSQLVGQDVDELPDIYDARVGGGFAFTAPAPGCAGEACKPAPAVAPAGASVGSGALLGVGNLAFAPSGAAVAPRARGLTRAQRLAAALRACRRRPKRQRASCVARAHRLYGPGKARKSSDSVRRAK